MKWIDLQLSEIEESPALTYYGALLAFVHALTFWSWSGGDFPARFGFAGANALDAVCWPHVPGCQLAHLLGPVALTWTARAYLALGLIGAALFAFRLVRAGYAILVAATLFKIYFYALDYRFGGEAHYLSLLATLGFLLVPGKVMFAKLLPVVAFAFAGLAHLNGGWIFGDGMPPSFFARGMPEWLFTHGLWPAAATVAALVGAVGVFGLLARDRRIYWTALGLVGFVLVASRVMNGDPGVGIWLSVLAASPLARMLDANEETPLTLPSAVVLGLFAFLQILPWVRSGDTLLTGEGRLFAITMFDGGRTCRSAMVAEFDDRLIDLSRENHAPPQWLACDPYVAMRQSQQLCDFLRAERGFSGLTLRLQSRRGARGPLRDVVHLNDACQRDVRYSWWANNEWIKR